MASNGETSMSRSAVSRVRSLLEHALVNSAAQGNASCVRHLCANYVAGGRLSLIAVDCVASVSGGGGSGGGGGETPLTAACINGHKAACRVLVEEAGASLSACNGKSWPPLLCAVKSSRWELVEYLLLAKSASAQHDDENEPTTTATIVNQTDKHGRSALILAASEGHLAIIDILIERGAALHGQDRDGLSALSWACLKGHFNAALTLIAHGLDVNHTDHSGRTPLDLATFYGDVRLVELLLDKGAQIEHADKISMRPLDRAISCRNVPIVSCLLRRGAKLGPATWAMASGKPEILITLLNKLVEDGNALYRVRFHVHS